MFRFLLVAVSVFALSVGAKACTSAIVPAGDHLYVVTLTEVAKIKASDLTVANKTNLPGGASTGDVSAVIHGDSLFILRGSDLLKVSLSDLSLSGNKTGAVSNPQAEPKIVAPSTHSSEKESKPVTSSKTDSTANETVYPTSSTLTKSK